MLRAGFCVDLFGYGIVQSYLLGFVIAALIDFIDAHSGLSRMHLVSSWPLWVQCAFFFVVHDLYIYAFHRWQHRNKFLWRIHEAHHSGRDVDWLSGTRSHALEIMINQTVEFARCAYGSERRLPREVPDLDFIRSFVDQMTARDAGSRLRTASRVRPSPLASQRQADKRLGIGRADALRRSSRALDNHSTRGHTASLATQLFRIRS